MTGIIVIPLCLLLSPVLFMSHFFHPSYFTANVLYFTYLCSAIDSVQAYQFFILPECPFMDPNNDADKDKQMRVYLFCLFAQGTILDRIDFNVEHASIKVEEGARQLKKADRYHRKNRNMKCILGLSGTIIVLIFLLVIIKM